MLNQKEKILPNLLDFNLEEMEDFIAASGKEKYRARQIMKWLHQAGVSSFEAMTTLARDFREKLAATARIYRPAIVKIQKISGRHAKSASPAGRRSVHRKRSHSRQEPLDALHLHAGGVRHGLHLLPDRAPGVPAQPDAGGNRRTVHHACTRNPEGAAVGNIVMMGMGEPLANYENTVSAIRILTSDFGPGMSNRRVTVSTCGLAPQIQQLGNDICINLAVSLNASDDETRSRLMPVNKKYPLASLLDACKQYPMPGRRMLTYEYILIDGVNSSRADAEKLARLLADQRCKINLIVFNEYPGSPFKSPSPKTVSEFQQVLLDRHYTAMLRKSKGSDILAACGQLSGNCQPP